MPDLLLASQSPRRRELLALLNLPFETTAANIVETPQAGEPPDELVARLSRAKARSVGSFPGALVIACDTVVALDGALLGKPRDADDAVSTLRRLRGCSHTVYSGVTLLDTVAGRTLTQVIETQVTMRPYSDAEIGVYVASGDPLDKAGAYAVQHAGFHPVAALRGCYANVMGLPLCHLTRLLRAWGIKPPGDVPTACQTYTAHHCAIYESILSERR